MEPRANQWDFVVKVKYGDTLKRFSAYVHGEIIDHNMTRLRKKIITLFKLDPEADLILTYADEDGDIVALDDDDDLRDAAIKQHLNPLRINVQLKSNARVGPDLKQENISSTTAVPGQEENQPPQISSAIEEALRSVPEPFRSALSNISRDLLLKAASSTPAIADIMDKLGISNFSQPVNSSTDESSGIPSQATTQPKDPNVSGEPKVLNTSAPVSTLLSDPVSEHLQKHHESVNGGQVGIVETHTSVDLNIESPHVPTLDQASGYPSIDDLLESIWTSNEITDHQKESDNVGRNGKSVVATTAIFTPLEQIAEQNETYNPSLAPTITCEFTGMVAGHNNKQLPTGAAPSGTPNGFSFEACKQYTSTAADLPFPSGLHPLRHPYQRDDGCNDNILRTFHKGIRCDGCGMHPIIGPRFKSNVKEDYDLCGICFSELGNEADYTRIDRAHHLSRRMFKDCYNTHSRRRFPSPHLHDFGVRPSTTKLESLFVKDLTVLDGTLMAPSTPFTKIWRMRNNGATRWPYGTRLVWVGGDRFANRDSVLLEIPVDGFPVNEEVDIAVDLTSPATPGRYFSYWRLASPSGQKFGQRVWILIQVYVSRPNSATGGFNADLNLNLPPESSSRDGFGIIDVNAEPFDEVAPEPVISNTSKELVKPFGNQIPTDITHPATTDGIALPMPEVVPPVSYPIIDLQVSEHESSLFMPPSITVTEDNAVEDTLLKELEDMGFKQIDLNKEILRLNKYDLEQSVDDLCGYAEWDPLLEELQEMGFSDRAKNKKLLIKNGGSIKRVVLDLIAGEKA